MRSRRWFLSLACGLAFGFPVLVAAHEPTKPAEPTAASAAGAAAMDAVRQRLKSEYLEEFDDAATKLKQLAAAMPADKYGWRPGPGVRSVGEVFMHVAGGEYFLLKMGGTPPPADWPKDAEKAVVEKDKVIAWMDRAIGDARKSVEQAGPEQMEKSVEFFGKQLSGRGLYLRMLNHMNEHLGQAIAYARINGVVPPWSQSEG